MEGIEIMALTDVAVRNAKPGPKPYKMGDSHGLFLLVQPTGGKLWRFKYRVDGREKKLAIGPYATDEMTAHGFRAMASTLLNESGKWNPDAIERAPAHGDTDKVRAAYHRGAHWKERVAMAQWWSDYLDELRVCAKSA
jgi:integrase